MRTYPIFLDLRGRRVFLLGSGEAAERRAATLADCGAVLEQHDHFDARLLPGCALAIGTGAPEAELQALFTEATRLGIPVNVIDRPDLSAYFTPSILDRDPLTIAVSTAGTAPVLARLLRQRLEALIAPGWGRLASIAERLQGEARRRFPDPALRRRVLERAFTGPAAELALAGQNEAAERTFAAALDESPSQQGIVHLVGAGPGAADLTTLRALRLLGEADVIVHDRLGTEAVLELARRDAIRIDVGKSQGDHTLPQREINALLIRLAREGKRVVRLKGGDPFVFGRGGEEVAALDAAGIPCTVTPGVTAALACAASARIPLTHRDAAHSVVFVTAHRRRADLGIDLGLLRPGVTLAIYMGLATLPRLCAELEAAGLPSDLPAVMIESGGTDQARTSRGPLCALAASAAGWTQGGPVLILLGGTASLPVAPECDTGQG